MSAEYTQQREAMIKKQIIAKGREIKDPAVIAAMQKVPRHLFVPEQLREYAYEDRPLPIEADQTISQPYIVAFMTEYLELKGHEKILEIGTGSGYQTAILAEVCAEIYSLEIIESLAGTAQQLLQSLGYTNIHIRSGNGYQGWADYAPFDAIIVTCAPQFIPESLTQQLVIGGKMIIPVGPSDGPQHLISLQKIAEDQLMQKDVLPVRFVPMTGANNIN